MQRPILDALPSRFLDRKRFLALACLAAGVALLGLAMYSVDVFGGLEQREVIGHLTDQKKNTGWEDLRGYVKIDDGTQTTRIKVEVNPDDGIERGDRVRATYVDLGWLGTRLLELEVLEGADPGMKLDISSHRPGPTDMAVAVAGALSICYGFYLLLRPGQTSVPS